MAKAWLRGAIGIVSFLNLTHAQNLFLSNDGLNVLQFNGVTGVGIGVFAPGPNPPNGLVVPSGLAFNRLGSLYVASVGNGRILKYDRNGVSLGTFATTGGFSANSGIAFGPDGNLYVASAGTSTIQKFDGLSGASLGAFVPSIPVPTGLTFGPDGNLYALSSGNSVRKYNGVTGALISVFVPTGSFSGAVDLKFGPDGNLYVPSVGPPVVSSVRKFSGSTGALLGTFVSTGSGGLAAPTGLTFGPDGNLYVSSLGRVLKYNGSTGAFLGVFVPFGSLGLVTPTYLAFAPRTGDAFQVNYAANLLSGDAYVNITNAGTVGGYDISQSIAPAGGICANVYVFDPSEEMVACCSCYVSPDGLRSLSVVNDLIVKTVTPSKPNGVVIKLLASLPTGGGGTTCNAASAIPNASGLRAWGASLHANTTTSRLELTENPFTISVLSESELEKLRTFCGFIQSNGSTFGICNACRVGGTLGGTVR